MIFCRSILSASPHSLILALLSRLRFSYWCPVFEFLLFAFRFWVAFYLALKLEV